MLFLRFLLFVISVSFVVVAAGLVIYDVFLAFELGKLLRPRESAAEKEEASQTSEALGPAATSSPAESVAERGAIQASVQIARTRRAVRWAAAAKLVVVAALLSLAAASILVVPDGEAAVRISQISGVRPGTLYAGTHFILPLIDRAQFYDVRDKVFSTTSAEGTREKLEVLNVETREGLEVGLAVTVRYRIDPRRLDYVQANLPQPIDQEIVAPVVTSVFREVAPNYVVRDIFAIKREEFRQRATQIITTRLGSDAIEVKEVLLRKIQLPEEYAAGLQGLLLKEQEDDRVTVDQSIEQKKVKIAESQAEAQKVRQIKHAEGDAQTRVLMAKAESDSMQYTLPLKQKLIEQSRLEAEARKQTTIQDAEAQAQAKVINSKAEDESSKLRSETQNVLTVKNAEAAAQAKVIDGKAELERRNLMADAEANNIRVTAQAEGEQLQLEAAALKINPLLVQYTVAERLSDRVQIMMVPNDGKFFFTNDVMKSASAAIDPAVKGK
ncbi:MAG TPA: SPFH domain-containing protein [Candidatus Acidoferrales bacterium]|nr:SPFH domain-containing protein [Candidatus Acidoferrales bacterium]